MGTARGSVLVYLQVFSHSVICCLPPLTTMALSMSMVGSLRPVNTEALIKLAILLKNDAL